MGVEGKYGLQIARIEPIDTFTFLADLPFTFPFAFHLNVCCCCLPCNNFSNWTWVVEEILAFQFQAAFYALQGIQLFETIQIRLLHQNYSIITSPWPCLRVQNERPEPHPWFQHVWRNNYSCFRWISEFSLVKASEAFQCVEQYAANLINQPWRLEYRTIRQVYLCCCCLTCSHCRHELLKQFGPLVLGCVLRTAGIN